MLVDLILHGKKALVLGDNEEAELKARKLLDGGAEVTVIGHQITKGIQKLVISRKVRLIVARPQNYTATIRHQRPNVVMVSTADPKLDRKLAHAARSLGALVCVVERPELNDFNMPASAKIGDISVAISTGGMSPAMASMLRRRIERTITKEDVLQVRLQHEIRRIAKDMLGDPASRKRLLYKIIHNRKIADLLRRNSFEEAKAHALEILRRKARPSKHRK